MVACPSKQLDTCWSIRFIGFEVKEDSNGSDLCEFGKVNVEIMRLGSIGSAGGMDMSVNVLLSCRAERRSKDEQVYNSLLPKQICVVVPECKNSTARLTTRNSPASQISNLLQPESGRVE